MSSSKKTKPWLAGTIVQIDRGEYVSNSNDNLSSSFSSSLCLPVLRYVIFPSFFPSWNHSNDYNNNRNNHNNNRSSTKSNRYKNIKTKNKNFFSFEVYCKKYGVLSYILIIFLVVFFNANQDPQTAALFGWLVAD